MYFTEVTGNRVSDHYARNIYIKVSLKMVVSWILWTSKILTNLFENNYNKCGAGLQPGTYSTRSFIF